MRKTIVLVIGATLLAAAVVFIVRAVRSLPHGESFYQPIVPGQVYRSGQPHSADWAWMHKHLGIRAVVDLRGVEDEGFDANREDAGVVGAGMKHVLIAINGREPKPEDIARFLELMDDPANRPALIHCAAGRVRSGLMVGVYRMEFQGWPNQRAVEEFMSLLTHEDQHTEAKQFLRTYERRSVPASQPTSRGGKGSRGDAG